MANWLEFGKLQVMGFVVTQLGYGITLAAGSLFQLSTIAALPTWAPFAGAALAGVLLCASTQYLIVMLINSLEECGLLDESDDDELFDKAAGFQIAGTLLFAPVLGAWALNLVLGWSLALTPMFYVGIATMLIALILILVFKAIRESSCCDVTNEKEDEIIENTVPQYGHGDPRSSFRRGFFDSWWEKDKAPAISKGNMVNQNLNSNIYV